MKVSRRPKQWYSQREDVELPAADGVAWGNFAEISSDPVIDEQLINLRQDIESGIAQGVSQDEEFDLAQNFDQDVESGMAQQLSQDIESGIGQRLSEDSIDIFRLISFLADKSVSSVCANNL